MLLTDTTSSCAMSHSRELRAPGFLQSLLLPSLRMAPLALALVAFGATAETPATPTGSAEAVAANAANAVPAAETASEGASATAEAPRRGRESAGTTVVVEDGVLVAGGEPLDRLGKPQWLPFEKLTAVAVDAKGGRVAVAGEGGVLRLFDAATGVEQRRLEGGRPVMGLAFSDDGKTLAATVRNGPLKIWNLETGAVEQRDLRAGPGFAVSADGSAIAAGSAGGVTVWETRAASGTTTSVLSGLTGELRSLAFDAAGKRLAAGSDDGSALVWDLAKPEEPVRLPGAKSAVESLAFSPNGLEIAAGTADGSIRVWHSRGRERRVVDGHSRAVTGVRYSSDGRFLLSASRDGTVRSFDTASGRELRRVLDAGSEWQGVAVSADGRVGVAISASRVVLFDPRSGLVSSELTSGPSPVHSISTVDPETFLLTTEDGAVRFVDVTDGSAVLDLSTDGRAARAAAVVGEGAAFTFGDGVVRLVAPAENGLSERRFNVGSVSALAGSENGALLAVATERGVRLFDTASGSVVATVDGVDSAVQLAFSPNGQRLAIRTASRDVLLADAATGERVATLSHAQVPSALTFASDGTLATAAQGTLQLWNGETGAASRRIDVRGERVTAVAFVDAERLLVGTASGAVESIALLPRGESRAGWVSAGSDPGAVRALAFAGGGESNRFAALFADGVTRVFGFPEDVSARNASASLHLTLRHGLAGWIAEGSDRFFRGDDGRFLRVAGIATGELSGVTPESGAEPALRAAVRDSVAAVDGLDSGRFVVRVSNAADSGAAYWVRLAPKKLPAGVSVVLPQARLRIDPGASADLPVTVHVSSERPGPRTESLELALVHSHGPGPAVPVRVQVKSAQVVVENARFEGSAEGRVARAVLRNTGDHGTGPLLVDVSFLLHGTPVSAGPRQQITDLSAGGTQAIAVDVPPKLALEDGLALQVVAQSDRWPTLSWTAQAPVEQTLPVVLLAGGAVLGLLLLALLVLVFLNYRSARNPIVVAVGNDPSSLLRFELTRLGDVNAALTRAKKLDAALAAANVKPATWKRALSAATGPEQTAAAFADSIGAELGGQVGASSLWRLSLPTLRIRFPEKVVVGVFTGADLDDAAAGRLGTEVNAGGQSTLVALDLTESQNLGQVLRNVPRLSFVVVDAAGLRDLLLAPNPMESFQQGIARQRPISEVSPYQTAGGVEVDAFFFGREKELRTITDRALTNYLVVGPRQVGKSSLLKAVRRRLSGRPDIEVHYFTLFEDDVAANISRLLNKPKPETPEQFMEVASGTRRRPRLWLIDEADAFIVADSRKRYPIAQAMRTLAEEGRAYFVLAGYWHLYAAACLNPNNPLRNFGELLRMEPLDRESARDLATLPMTAMNIEYERPSLVEKLLDATACRAHLVVAACRGMVDGLGTEGRVITEALVEQGLYRNPGLADELKYWRREPLSRAVLRAVLMGKPPTRNELRERLDAVGLRPSTDVFSAALDRLELSYLLVPDADGRLKCPVPVLTWFVSNEEDLARGLARDAEDFNAQSSSAA